MFYAIAYSLIALFLIAGIIVAARIMDAGDKAARAERAAVLDDRARNRAWIKVELDQGRAVATPFGYAHTRGFGYITGPYGDGTF